MSKSLSQELIWRGFAHQTTLSDARELDKNKVTFYWGVDPSADSMTIGNLAIAVMVKHFINHGHNAILLVGGATGVIGDPDGKSKERQLLDQKSLNQNKQNIINQYKKIFAGQDFEIVDNQDWFDGINYIDFLRDIGKHVPMRQMLGREFVQSRLGEDSSGISYAEFSYSLIQAYDFLHLLNTKDVTLQVCGSDQWGNSIAGVELIRRVEGKEAHIWSAPLIINKSTGEKFGKSEDGAVWLSPDKTSPYKFYQFWLNVDDQNSQDYLKIYTLLSKEEIEKVISEFKQNPALRKAQKTLAYEVTKLVHGAEAADSQKLIAEALFGKDDSLRLSEKEYKILAAELPKAKLIKQPSVEDLADALMQTNLASSKTEARRFIEGGAIYINNEKVSDNLSFEAGARHAIIRRGRNNCAIIEIS